MLPPWAATPLLLIDWMDARLTAAQDAAKDAFWDTLAKYYPEIETGDIGPEASQAFDEACNQAVLLWVDGNA